MVIQQDIPRELRRARNQAVAMLVVSGVGLAAFDSTVAFVALALNAVLWLVRFWYFVGQLHEHSLVFDTRRDL